MSTTIHDVEQQVDAALLSEVVEQVKEDMSLWSIGGPDNQFKKGFDTAVRKYAEILGLLDTPLYEDWEDANGNR